MKKLIYIFSVLVVIFSSCSKDETSDSLPAINPQTPTNAENSLLVKKIIKTTSTWGAETINFSYNGSKLVGSSTPYGTKCKYYYTNNLITEIDGYDYSDNLSFEVRFTYNSQDKLIKCTYKNVAWVYGEQMDYIHMPDGSISFKKYTWDISNQDLRLKASGLIYNDRQEFVFYEVNGDVENSGATDFDLDEKNHPFKNVTGFDKISFVPSVYFEFVSKPFDDEVYNIYTCFNFQHNITKLHMTSVSGFLYNTIAFNYNSFNFPTLEIMNELGSIEAARYEYFYIGY